MNPKAWYLSKTIWTNLIAAIGLVLNSHSPIISGEELAAFVVVINLILRLVTKQPIAATNSSNAVPAIALLCLLGLLFQGCQSVPPGYDAQMHPYRPEYIAVQERQEGNRDAVVVRATEERVEVGIDLLGIRNYQAGTWARESWGPLKLLTYPLDYVGYMATNHPFQTLGIGLAAWELTDSGVSDLFDGGGGSGGGSGKAEAPSNNTGTVIQVTGNQNTVNYAPATIIMPPAPTP